MMTAVASCPSALSQLVVRGRRWPPWCWPAVRLRAAARPDQDRAPPRFERAVGLYAGSDVRLHGIKIGTITKVKPDGDGVLVRMEYDTKIKLPAYPTTPRWSARRSSRRRWSPTATSSCADFDSCTTGCPVLASGAAIPMNQTAAPVELDDIYAALDKLNVALGPKGANVLSATARCRT